MATRLDPPSVRVAPQPASVAATRPFVLAAVMLGCLAVAGCRTMLPEPAQAPPRDRNAELVMYISDQPYVTAEPAYRAVYVLAKGTLFAGEFSELAATLANERLIGKTWQHAPNEALDRGTVGHMICRACQIRTGLNWNLTGLGRYAWRELIYHGIAEGGSEYGLLSGGEFVGILLRAEEYRHKAGQDVDRAELGSRQ